MLVAHRDDQAGWLEEGTAGEVPARFDLPVTHLGAAED